jgi:hypothetical protein
MQICIFTPENAEGFGALELAEMNAAYARLKGRRERATGSPLDAGEHERLCALIRDAVMALRRIIGEVERREISYPPQ